VPRQGGASTDGGEVSVARGVAQAALREAGVVSAHPDIATAAEVDDVPGRPARGWPPGAGAC
jgi:hypothetical protein